MGYCIMWVILTMMSFQMALSYNVSLSPESITTEVGTDSVNFTCTIQLEIFEALSEHWIIWWKDNSTSIVDNDEVLINSAKYSVHGISSAVNIDYTQTLQVNGIEETDHGIYTCSLVFPSYFLQNDQELIISLYSTLIIRNFIPQPVCSTIPSGSGTGQQMTLFCTSSPSDPPIIIYWNDNNGNTLASKQQDQNERLTLEYTVSLESSNQWFTCRANSTGSTDTKECVIGDQTSTTMMPKLSSSNNNINTIIIFAVLAGVILMTVFIAMLLLLRTHLKTSKNEEIHLKKCAKGKHVNTAQSNSEHKEPEGGIDIHNENQDHQLIPTEFGDGQLDGQCAVYKNSEYETNMDDPDPSYAVVGQKNVEESQGNVATDDSKKTKGIYPLEDNPEYMSIEETALKKALDHQL